MQADGQPLRGGVLPLEPEAAYQPVTVAEYSVPDYPAFFLQSNTRTVDLRPYFRTFRSWREDGWKFIWSSDGDHELYHLSEDPGEQHNRIDDHPDRARQLEKNLQAWVAGLAMFEVQRGDDEGELSPELEAEALRQLEELGVSVVSPSAVLETTRDKVRSFQRLARAGVALPAGICSLIYPVIF